MTKLSKQNIAQDVPTLTHPDTFGMRVWWLVTRETTGCESLVLSVAEIPPGAIHWHHRHPYADQVILVVRGRGVHLLENASVELEAGEAAHIPAMQWHGFANPGPDEVAIVTVYGGVGSREEAGYELHPRAAQLAQSILGKSVAS